MRRLVRHQTSVLLCLSRGRVQSGSLPGSEGCPQHKLLHSAGSAAVSHLAGRLRRQRGRLGLQGLVLVGRPLAVLLLLLRGVRRLGVLLLLRLLLVPLRLVGLLVGLVLLLRRVPGGSRLLLWLHRGRGLVGLLILGWGRLVGLLLVARALWLVGSLLLLLLVARALRLVGRCLVGRLLLSRGALVGLRVVVRLLLLLSLLRRGLVAGRLLLVARALRLVGRLLGGWRLLILWGALLLLLGLALLRLGSLPLQRSGSSCAADADHTHPCCADQLWDLLCCQLEFSLQLRPGRACACDTTVK